MDRVSTPGCCCSYSKLHRRRPCWLLGRVVNGMEGELVLPVLLHSRHHFRGDTRAPKTVLAGSTVIPGMRTRGAVLVT